MSVHGKSIALAAVLLLGIPLRGAAGEFVDEYPGVADAVTLLDLWVEEQRSYRGVPGLVLGVVYDQELVWAKGYGTSDLATKTPITPATLFRVGSVTKLFTSVAILQLRDRGKLRLDDPVALHLPWFEVESSFEGGPEITIRHLLTHTSGLPREAAFPYWSDHDFPTIDEIKEALPGQSAIYAPATRYKYSNLGMALLGEVVAVVSGEPYADYLWENVLEPLGMTSSTVAPTEEHLGRMTTAYLRRQDDGSRGFADYYETRGIAPAANLVSNVEDLARFAALQFRDAPRAGGAQILKGGTVREMQRPHWVYPSWTGGRGLGFVVSRRDGKTFVLHGGWVAGHRTLFLLVPDEKIAVITVVNADDTSPSTFGYQAYEVVGAAITQAVTPKPEKKVPDPAWQKLLGDYVDPWGWEYKVMILGGGLVMYEYDYPPGEDPERSLTRLEPVAANTFRMPDGEPLVFELGEDGKVDRIQRRYDYIYPKDAP